MRRSSTSCLTGTALPSITGIATAGPMSPRPSAADPLQSPATELRRAVYVHDSAGSSALACEARSTPGVSASGQLIAIANRHGRLQADCASAKPFECRVADCASAHSVMYRSRHARCPADPGLRRQSSSVATHRRLVAIERMPAPLEAMARITPAIAAPPAVAAAMSTSKANPGKRS